MHLHVCESYLGVCYVFMILLDAFPYIQNYLSQWIFIYITVLYYYYTNISYASGI